MSDMSDNDNNYVEDLATAYILAEAWKHSGSKGDDSVDHTAEWEELHRRSKQGLIAKIVRINTVLWSVAMIGALIYVGIRQLLGL